MTPKLLANSGAARSGDCEMLMAARPRSFQPQLMGTVSEMSFTLNAAVNVNVYPQCSILSRSTARFNAFSEGCCREKP